MKNWFVAILLELPVLAYVILARFFPILNSTKPISGGDGRPILLVHGYCNNSWVWVWFRKWLFKGGLGPIYTLNLGHPFRSLHFYSEKIEEKARLIAEEMGSKKLILIGHSMGGIASVLYAKRAPSHTVTHLITIASPWEGTIVARIGIGQNMRELSPNSDFLHSIESVIDERKDIRFYQIAAKCDFLVVPGVSAARKVNVKRRMIVEDLGHTGLLFSQRVANQVIRWLTD